jgi:type II secretory pathway pseudopilin PulG
MSLIEATIILMVLGLLTSVLSPSIGDYVADAKAVKVKEDCEAIGITIARMTRDIGPCLKLNGAAPCMKANRVDLLHSEGPDVLVADLEATAVPFSSAGLAAGSLNWDADNSANSDSMERQFVTNGAGYSTNAVAVRSSGPHFGLGWRGAYMSADIGPDPWGKRYLANTAFLGTAADAGTDGDGSVNQGWSRDVICLSAGANGLFQTPIGGTANFATLRGGDDYVTVISGGTH